MPCWSTCGKESKMAFPKQQNWLHTWNPYSKEKWLTESCQINKIVEWRSKEIISENNTGTNTYLIFVLKCISQWCHSNEPKPHPRWCMLSTVVGAAHTSACFSELTYFLLSLMLQQVQMLFSGLFSWLFSFLCSFQLQSWFLTLFQHDHLHFTLCSLSYDFVVTQSWLWLSSIIYLIFDSEIVVHMFTVWNCSVIQNNEIL